MRPTYNYRDIVKKYPEYKREPLPEIYNKILIDSLCNKLPKYEKKIRIIDKDIREKRIAGNTVFIGEKNRPIIKFISKFGVIRMVWLCEYLVDDKGIIWGGHEISVYNPDVTFKKYNSNKEE